MKLLLFPLLILIACNSNVTHTNYSDYLLDDNREIEENFNGGQMNFMKMVAKNIKQSDNASELYSQALVLLEVQVQKDSTKIFFTNSLGLGYEEEIQLCFSKIQSQWHFQKEEIVNFKMSIAFSINVGDTNSIPHDSSSINITAYSNPNDLIWSSDDLYRDAFFKDNTSLVKKRDFYLNQGNSDSAQIFEEELIRRDPLRHFIKY
jgi:hypothetical protein